MGEREYLLKKSLKLLKQRLINTLLSYPDQKEILLPKLFYLTEKLSSKTHFLWRF